MAQVPPNPPQVDKLVIQLNGPITHQVAEQFLTVLAQARQAGAKAIQFHLSTVGGNCDAGIAMYSAIRAYPIPIEAHNLSRVDSIGGVVFAACNVRKAPPYASFLVHDINYSVEFGQSLTAKSLEGTLTGAEFGRTQIVQILSERTRLTESQIRDCFDREKRFTAEEALTVGLVTEVGCPVVTAEHLTHTLQSFGS